MDKSNKNIAIKVCNFEGYFKIDLWFSLEQEMRGLNNITKIVLDRCLLTKEHLKILKGYILFQPERYLRVVLSSNNLNYIDLDYLIFANGEAVCRQILSNNLSLSILNNYGVFRNQLTEKIVSKIGELAIISKDGGIITLNPQEGDN